MTVWDYERHANNDFIGEATVELAKVPLNNEPSWHYLTHPDDSLEVQAAALP